MAEPPGMRSQAEPGNEIVSIISTPYRDVYNDKPSRGEFDLSVSMLDFNKNRDRIPPLRGVRGVFVLEVQTHNTPLPPCNGIRKEKINIFFLFLHIKLLKIKFTKNV